MRKILEFNNFINDKILWIVGIPSGEAFEVSNNELDTLMNNNIVKYDIDLGFYKYRDVDKSSMMKIIDNGFYLWVSKNYNSSLDKIEHIDCSKRGFLNLRGIEKFIHLKVLYCDNNHLTSLNIDNLQNLKFLDCHDNQLNDLDTLNNLTEIEELYCSGNKIEDLDSIENLKKLTTLHCSNNKLTNLLVIEKFPKIRYITCSSNRFSTTYKNYLISYCERNEILINL